MARWWRRSCRPRRARCRWIPPRSTTSVPLSTGYPARARHGGRSPASRSTSTRSLPRRGRARSSASRRRRGSHRSTTATPSLSWSSREGREPPRPACRPGDLRGDLRACGPAPLLPNGLPPDALPAIAADGTVAAPPSGNMTAPYHPAYRPRPRSIVGRLLAWDSRLRRLDGMLLVAVLLLSAFGALLVWSATRTNNQLTAGTGRPTCSGRSSISSLGCCWARV